MPDEDGRPTLEEMRERGIKNYAYDQDPAKRDKPAKVVGEEDAPPKEKSEKK